jgi:hypothetical protein
MTSKMFTRQDAAMAASAAIISQDPAEKMIQMALGKSGRLRYYDIIV